MPAESYPRYSSRLSPSMRTFAVSLGPIYPTMPHIFQPFFFLIFLRRMLYLLTPPLDVLLLHPADGQCPFRNIFRDGGACTDRGATAHLDRSHQLHIRSHKDPIPDDRLMFLESIIVTDDRPSADVDALLQVGNLRYRPDDWLSNPCR